MSAVQPDAGRLRVGVVVAGEVVPAWIAEVLSDLVTSASVDLIGVWLAQGESCPAYPPAISSRVARILMQGDERLFGGRSNLLSPVDVRSWAQARAVGVTESTCTPSVAPVEQGGEASTAVAEVVIDLSGGVGTSSPCAGARSAVWWMEGVPVRAEGIHAELPQVGTSVLRARPVIGFTLRARRPGQSKSVILYDALCPTHPSSPLVTCMYLAASARQLIVEKLTNATVGSLRQTGSSAVTDSTATEPEPGAAEPLSAVPQTPGRRRDGAIDSIAVTSRFIARVARRQAHKAMSELRWNLLVGRQAPERMLPDLACLRPIFPPAGRYWADPFAVEHDGRTHILFEEFLYGERRGRISIITLDEDGAPGPAHTALELGSHLSYPCVFHHEGRLFMVPENAGGGGVDLYECLDLPDRWVRRRSLLEGVRIVDSSLVEWGGLWWMFASLQKPAGLRTAELLVLYFSEDPVKGVWRKHSMSPLLADVTNARPAGAPFVFGERLFRLAQDGSKGYGSAIAVNEVLSLTPTHYAERRLARLAPSWAATICGTHTLNRAGRTVVMDECREVRRSLLRPRADSLLA